MTALVITNCTGRKRVPPGQTPVGLSSGLAGSYAQTGVEGLAHAWSSQLAKRQSDAVPAAELYAGRAFSDAKSVASTLGANLFVVSAGCGLVGGAEKVAPYELTVADGPGSIQSELARLGATLQAWWTALNAASGRPSLPLARRLSDAAYDLVLVALPARYIELVAHDLDAIPDWAQRALRIFTSPAGLNQVPARLQSQVLPYDERLDGAGSSRLGTRVDFPQRAMRHYVEDLGAAGLPLAEGREAVERALFNLVRPVVPDRRRATDQEILGMLKRHWSECGGHSSKLLRFLRDEKLMACEQSRFRVLWNQMREELRPSLNGKA